MPEPIQWNVATRRDAIAMPQLRPLAAFQHIHAVDRPRSEHDVVNTDDHGYAIETNTSIARLG
jgi:hypothetical protein